MLGFVVLTSLLPMANFCMRLSAAEQSPDFTTHLFAISHKYFQCSFILILVLRGGEWRESFFNRME